MIKAHWAALWLALFSAAALQADTMYNFQTFDVPGALSDASWGIDGAGDVAGYYTTGNGNLGFEYNPATQNLTTLNGPANASDIQAYGINDNGQIVGTYRDSSNVTHGFLYSNGTYTTIDGAGNQYGTYVSGINNSGQIALSYSTSLFPAAYRWTPSGSGYTTQSVNAGSDGSHTGGINNLGQIAGYYQTPSYGGFVWNADGTYSTFTEPNDTGGMTQALDINDSGMVVGSFFDSTHIAGFVEQGGNFQTINVPGSNYTYVTGVNDSGEIAGWYLASNETMHSFVATPVPEPASLVLLALGVGVCVGLRKTKLIKRALPWRTSPEYSRSRG